MVEMPRACVISTGTEITQGLYADTNAMSLSRLLKDHGFWVVGHAAAPDDENLIRDAIRNTFGRVDLVIVTGGLGPTQDDLNREIIAELWDTPLVHVNRAAEMIRGRFRNRGVQMPPRNLKQANTPKDAKILLNFWGTAPGFFLRRTDDKPALLALPGVPSEWRSMMGRYFERDVLPSLPQRPFTRIHTIHLALVPESTVNECLSDLFDRDEGVMLGLLASRGIIRVRIATRGKSEAQCEQRLARTREEVLNRLPQDIVLAEGPDTLTAEEVVIQACRTNGLTIATAESCTGGGVAKRLTNVPGSSSVLLEGFVTYSNRAKERTLGIEAGMLASEGAVSEACAAAMAAGARDNTGADLAVAITGIAGPDGGSDEKPVGTVWFAVSSRRGTETLLRHFPADRNSVREWSENQALDLLRRCAADLPIQADLTETWKTKP